MILSSIIFVGLSLVHPVSGQSPAVAPLKSPISFAEPLLDKNFYLLGLLKRSPEIAQSLASDPALAASRTRALASLSEAYRDKSLDQMPQLRRMLFSPEEVESVSRALKSLYNAKPAIRKLVDGPLRQSGMYFRYQSEAGGDLLARAWQDCASGVNNAILVYGTGKPGRTAGIDSMFYNPKAFEFNGLIHNWFGSYSELAPTNAPFFAPTTDLALWLMDVNRRDEAARFEPMEKGENRSAYQKIRSTNWAKYPYSVILIPGMGPDEPQVQFSPAAKLILRLAAKRYREGKAPFLITSGGYVHPNQTPYCEAFEMKRFLISEGVPASAILIDPHARHTTTNMRNAARIMYRYGIPFDKPGLTTTNTYQSADLSSEAFRNRCQRVFGYQPYKALRRISDFDLEFLPMIDSLYADPQDPLDP